MARFLSRRQFLVGIGGLTAAGLLAACGDDSPDAPADTGDVGATDATATTAPAADSTAEDTEDEATEEPMSDTGGIQRGGHLNILQINDFVSMDPIHASGPSAQACYDWLLAWRPTGDGQFGPEPMLAESWEITDDGIIFTLREGVQFHDGSDFDADVVVWNLTRMVQNPQSFAAPYIEAVDPDNPAEAIDDMTVQINLTQPSAAVLAGLSDVTVQTAIVSMQAAEDNGEEWLQSNPVGTGPYVFESWRSGDSLEVTKNDNYWQMGEDGEPLPYTDAITYRVIIEASTQFTEMRAGTTDYIANVRGRDVPAAREISHAVYVESPFSGLKRQYFYNSNVPLLNDNPLLRQAINHAINREAMAEALGGELGIPLPYQFAPGQIGYDESVPYYEFDLDKARQLIEESGVETPVEIRLTVHNREVDQRQAELIQAMLQQIDVQINLDVVERVAWGEKVRINNDFEMATRQTGVPPDPTSSLLIEWAEEGNSAYHRAVVPGLRDLILEADAESDPEARHDLFVEAQQLMHESAWYGYMWFELGNYMHHERVQNVPEIWGNLRAFEWWIDG